jgi:TRAP-type transport system small permease protein
MQNAIEKFETGFNRLTFFLAALVAISIAMVAVLIPLNFALTKLGWGSISWVNEGVEYALYTGVFLGAPWVLQQGKHVRVEILAQSLPRNAAAWLGRLVDGYGALLCFFLSSYGARSAWLEFVDGTLPDKSLRIYTWIMMVIFAFAFLLLAIEFLLRLRRPQDGVAIERKPTSMQGL